MNQQDAWLAQVSEDVLEPKLPIVDPHHHLWRHGEAPYLLEELWRDTGTGHNVEETVFIECGAEYYEEGPDHLKPVGETAFVAEIAKTSQEAGGRQARISAIVGHASLLLGAGIEEVLDAHIEAGDGLFRGIRHSAAWDASDEIRASHSNPPLDLLERPETREALQVLGRKGLTFDAWFYHPFVNRFTALVHALPETGFILDHFGGPIGIGPYVGKQDEIFEAWKGDIAELAKCENVSMKLGGLAMPVNGWGWHNREKPATSDELVAAHSRYYSHVIDCFGTARCMFESNFPVDKRSISYGSLWNAFKKMASGCSDVEKTDLFSGTARRVYRID